MFRDFRHSVVRFINPDNFIDLQLDRAFDGYAKWPVHVKVFPLYKLVDLYRAAQAFVAGQPNVREICSQHDEPLSRIFNKQFTSNNTYANCETLRWAQAGETRSKFDILCTSCSNKCSCAKSTPGFIVEGWRTGDVPTPFGLIVLKHTKCRLSLAVAHRMMDPPSRVESAQSPLLN